MWSGNAGRTIRDRVSLSIRLVPIAEIARPHGVRGELRLKVYNPETEVLGKGRRVVVRERSGAERSARILAARAVPQATLIELEGVGDRDAAERIRGATLLVPRSELPPLEDGEFYAFDIEGARAELVNGDHIGTVRSLESYPTCDVIVIDTTSGARIEVPLVDDVIDAVDAEAHVVRLKSVEGL